MSVLNRAWVERCACLTGNYTYDLAACPCKARLKRCGGDASETIDRVLYNKNFVNTWLNRAMNSCSANCDRYKFREIFYDMVDRAAHIWFNMYILYSHKYSKHVYFRMVFPQFGVWVMTKHDDSVCLVGRPYAEYTYQAAECSNCTGLLTSEGLCSLSECRKLPRRPARLVRADEVSETMRNKAPLTWERIGHSLKYVAWRRMVVDEYHTVAKKINKLMHLHYESCWFITATPDMSTASLGHAMHNFMGVRCISSHMTPNADRSIAFNRSLL